MIHLKLYNAYVANDLAFQGATRYKGIFLSFDQAKEAIEKDIGPMLSSMPAIAKPSETGFTDQLWVRHNIQGESGEGVIMEVTAFVTIEDLRAAILNPVDIIVKDRG